MRFQLLGERRAISLLMLGFLTTIFAIIALSMGGAWARCFGALAAVYGVGFFGLAAEWFWSRWYTMGIGVSGITMAVLGLATAGWNIGLAIWGGIHLLIYLPLLGESMADRYENQNAWRERYSLDEYGVARIKRAVKSAATALPTLVFYTLAPREEQGSLVLLLALVGLGTWGLIRMRFWGVTLLGVATVWTAASVATQAAGVSAMPLAFGAGIDAAYVGLFALGALGLAVSPFVVPAFRYLRR